MALWSPQTHDQTTSAPSHCLFQPIKWHSSFPYSLWSLSEFETIHFALLVYSTLTANLIHRLNADLEKEQQLLVSEKHFLFSPLSTTPDLCTAHSLPPRLLVSASPWNEKASISMRCGHCCWYSLETGGSEMFVWASWIICSLRQTSTEKDRNRYKQQMWVFSSVYAAAKCS